MYSTNTTITDQITQIQLLKPYLKKKGEQHKRHAYVLLWHRARRYLSGNGHREPFEGASMRTTLFSAAPGAAGARQPPLPRGEDSPSPPCQQKALSGSQRPHQRALGRGDSASQEPRARQNNPTTRKAASPRASSSRARAFVISSPSPASSSVLNAQKSPCVSITADINATTCSSKCCTG